MPADSLHILKNAEELNSILKGGRITKITMPEPDETVLFIHAKNTYALVLSANPSLPRVHITSAPPKKNPITAPAFLMHLRKHIGGATIDGIKAVNNERIIKIELTSYSELGYEDKKTLVCEIMGKYANVILLNSDGKISEAIKHISPLSSDVHPVLPGLVYTPPPPQNKADIFDGEQLKSLLKSFCGGKLDGFISAGAAGLAPVTVTAIITKELNGVYFDTITDEQIAKLVGAFDKQTLLNGANPCVRKDVKRDFWIAPFYADSEYDYYPTLNAAMDSYYCLLDINSRLQEKLRAPKIAIKNAIARTEKKIKMFEERLLDSADCEREKLFGELITANIYRLKQGMKSFEAENYYADPPQTVTVPLDETKSPQYNAQSYYKRYNKKKRTAAITGEQLEREKAALEYYNSIQDCLYYVDEEGISDVVSELIEAGVMREQKKQIGKKQKPSLYGEFVYRNCVIRWGKSNIQNEKLTRSAKNGDMWLHTQKIHGSHVVISGSEITDEVIERAAQIAAYYSKARMSEKVPVDYTYIKYVSKPKGSAYGKVVYTDYKTVMVTPKAEG